MGKEAAVTEFLLKLNNKSRCLHTVVCCGLEAVDCICFRVQRTYDQFLFQPHTIYISASEEWNYRPSYRNLLCTKSEFRILNSCYCLLWVQRTYVKFSLSAYTSLFKLINLNKIASRGNPMWWRLLWFVFVLWKYKPTPKKGFSDSEDLKTSKLRKNISYENLIRM